MIAEIISIGNEILHGSIDDTNATYISQTLIRNGIEPLFRSTVSDNFNDIKKALEYAAGRADLIVTTGGLGPTVDDITIEAAASFFEKDLIIHQETVDKIKKFYEIIGIEFNESVLNQARIPDGAVVIRNNAGTAPGIIYPYNNKFFLFFPGVPRELRSMLDDALSKVIPDNENQVIRSRSIRVFGIGESNVESILPKEITTCENPKFAFLPQRFEVELRLTAKCETESECKELLDKTANEIYTHAGKYIYGENNDTLEKVVFEKLKKKNLTLSCAESCTGGMLSSMITRIPGSSEVLMGGMVCYSIKSKKDILGVPADLLEEYGPVSEQVAMSMAENVIGLFHSDIGISITGNAGPSSGDDKSKTGDLFIAIASTMPGFKTTCMYRNIGRNRNDVREIAAKAALDLIIKSL